MDTASELKKIKAEMELVARLLERSGHIDTLPSLTMRLLRNHLPNKPHTAVERAAQVIDFPTQIQHVLRELVH